MGLPELPTTSDINNITLEIVEKTQFDVLNKKCVNGDNDACSKVEKIASTMGGKGKSNRKTKKAKYSKRK